jgi:histidinol-phosphate/aromatic aminotransferase/cobyric acid decarboxylase-like protein
MEAVLKDPYFAAGQGIADLTYDEYSASPVCHQLGPLLARGNVACLSLSKSAGVAAARLGVLFADPTVLSQIVRLTDMFSLDRFQVLLVEALFSREGIAARRRLIARTRALTEVIADLVQAVGVPERAILPHPAHFVTVDTTDVPVLAQALLPVTDCKAFPSEGLLRLAATERTAAALRAMRADDCCAATATGIEA